MTTRDYFTLLKKAQKGDHEAQFHLGHQYYSLKQFKRAHSWWLKSAKQNKSLGPLFNVGNLYLNGWGVKQNIKKALHYFELVISKKIIFLPEQKVKWSELALFLIGKTYFCGTFDGAISVWNTQQCLQDNQRQKDHNDSVNDMSFSISSKTLFSAGADNNLFAYDLESGKAREKLVGHSGPINSLAISNDGRCVYSKHSTAK